MSQPRQFQMVGGSNVGGGQYHDTTYTKIFVGGLAWETQRETMRGYFEQFGEIQEAVVITDKHTGRSKGYGFVTFRDPDAAMRACQNPSPVIDGRRANCNLASLGAQKTLPPTPQHDTLDIHKTTCMPWLVLVCFHICPMCPLATGLNISRLYLMALLQNYYNMYGGQHFSPYYSTGASGPPGVYPNFYPFCAQYAQSSQAHGYGVQYPQVIQYPYYGSSAGILSLPSSIAMATTTAGIDCKNAYIFCPSELLPSNLI
ncbi:hypothetical protein RJ639_036828 [Escallonia herrerae]|uniref:RRM domain-containing protein n=1 Tax=Escallonia herrerae TaxID=1293975 RepID=A0AA88WU65_9ASTE|nr:hypothetical protein RJ639_036828 [Escallonia herrerae]